MKNISPSGFLENFAKQHRTPKSEQNQEMENGRKKLIRSYCSTSPKATWGRSAFYDQIDMSTLRWCEEMSNSVFKRTGRRPVFDANCL